MIKHIVMWRLKEQAHGNDKVTNARRIKQMLEALRGKIPGLLTIEVGIDFLASEQSADIALYSEFESRAALEGYQSHPEHKALGPFMREATIERRVADYEV